MDTVSAVHLDIRGAIAELRLDNPAKLNAFTVEMLEQLAGHLDSLDRNTGVACVLLTAVESKAFCSGADINGWGDLTPAEFARHWVRGGHRIFDRLARLSKPVIAALNGHAFGGGLELAACADIRVMAPRATLALPEARVGVVPGWSGTQRLCRLLPEAAAVEAKLDRLKAERERLGAVNLRAESEATEIAEEAAKLSPRAVEITKTMIHAAVAEDRGAMVEALGSAAIAASDDRAEGVAAFREKRNADFPGT